MTNHDQIWAEALRVLRRGKPFVLATVVNVRGSTPREVGAKMIVRDDGQFGTIGGGCGEAEVFRKARVLLEEKSGARLTEVDLTGDFDQQEIGTCGGIMDVLIDRWSPEHDLPYAQELADAADRSRPAALLTVVDTGEHGGPIGAGVVVDPAKREPAVQQSVAIGAREPAVQQSVAIGAREPAVQQSVAIGAREPAAQQSGRGAREPAVQQSVAIGAREPAAQQSVAIGGRVVVDPAKRDHPAGQQSGRGAREPAAQQSGRGAREPAAQQSVPIGGRVVVDPAKREPAVQQSGRGAREPTAQQSVPIGARVVVDPAKPDPAAQQSVPIGARVVIDPAKPDPAALESIGLPAFALEQIAERAADSHAGLLEVGEGGLKFTTRIQPTGATRIFIDPIAGAQRLIIVGAGHIAQPLAALGTTLGFHVTVIDDRHQFANRERFPTANQLIVKPFRAAIESLKLDKHCYLVSVTRGHAYDEEAVAAALAQPCGFVGMIGSRRRVKATLDRLIEAGIARARAEQVHAPLGLDIGAETPEEIAVAIIAEIIRERRTGVRDSGTLGVKLGRLKPSP